jgi:hypothetical protein
MSRCAVRSRQTAENGAEVVDWDVDALRCRTPIPQTRRCRVIWKPLFLSLACALIGCATLRPTLSFEYRACPMVEPTVWNLLRQLPRNSAALLAIANPDPEPSSAEDSVRLFWFEAVNRHILLCRAVTSAREISALSGCASSSWEFEQTEGTWGVAPDGERLIFCH